MLELIPRVLSTKVAKLLSTAYFPPVSYFAAMAHEEIMDIEATIICERDSHKGIIIGKQGSMLKKIGTNARYEIEQMLECQANLKIWVKVRKDWRDSDVQMKNFGYNPKDI